MKRALQILSVAINVILILTIGAASILAFTARRSRDGIPTVLGHKVLAVISGSMEPAVHTGDVIIVRPLTAGQVPADGDIITFRSKDKPDMLITHRVVGTVKINGEPRAFVTKGDANDAMDLSAVSIEQVVGRYAWRVPYFGYVSSFLHKPLGIVLFVILPGIVLVGLELRKMWKAVNEAEAAKAAAGRAQAAPTDVPEAPGPTGE